ncbi:MAG: hypothetical protein JWO95_3173, partial [Verrucomicrobiales bacterium]|nr:hypothetical protein [Verrucomicrobiales bacterium]
RTKQCSFRSFKITNSSKPRLLIKHNTPYPSRMLNSALCTETIRHPSLRARRLLFYPIVNRSLSRFLKISNSNPTVPNPRHQQNRTTPSRKPNQERNRRSIISRNRPSKRQGRAKITIKRAGLRSLETLIENRLNNFVITRERFRAVNGTHQTRATISRHALHAQPASAISANPNRLDHMFSAFHDDTLPNPPAESTNLPCPTGAFRVASS